MINKGDKFTIRGFGDIIDIWSRLDDAGKEVLLRDIDNLDSQLSSPFTGLALMGAMVGGGLTWVYDDKGEVEMGVTVGGKEIFRSTLVRKPIDKSEKAS